jgi:putative ubiquitin-RnfH superfamily antitoxin RatB of RatAB toxin-antitoxin module
MNVSVSYADQLQQLWLKFEVDEGTTVEQAINQSGILQRVPAIDLENQKVGVFGKAVKLDRKLEDGERVEIYRPITADPETVERRF